MAAHDYRVYVPQEAFLIALDNSYDPPLCGFRTAAAGDVSITDSKGVTTVIPALVAGETFKCAIKKINTSGTTVTSPTTNIVGFRH